MNAASPDIELVKLLVNRARRLIAIKCYGEAGATLDYLQAQLRYGVDDEG